MKFTTAEIARLVKGVVQGDEGQSLIQLSKIEEAQEGSLTFLANLKYEPMIYQTKASAVLVDQKFVAKENITPSLIVVEDVYASLTVLMNMIELESKNDNFEISSLAFVDKEAQLGEVVGIGAFSYIGKSQIGESCMIGTHVYIADNCVIGKNVKIYAGVKIYPDTKIADNVIIHANAVIGSDGFGFAKDAEGKYIKMNQLGNVIIEEDVEIGSNTVIDRASIGSTLIKRGVKLDNLIQVAHNVEIGEDTVMAAQSGIAGSTKLGKNCMIGGQVGFIGHLKIADGAQIQAQSGVAGSVKEKNSKLYGYPAIDYNTYLRAFASLKHLPEMAKKLRQLEKELQKLKGTP